MIVIVASLSEAQIAAAKASYQQLTDTTEHVAKKKPPKHAEKIDVSSRMRSASFGHKTWLHVAPDGSEFWVEFGGSTNKPGGLYGPFPVIKGAGEGTAAPPAEHAPPPGPGEPGAPKPDGPGHVDKPMTK